MVNNHGDRKFPKDRVVGPLPNGRKKWLTNRGDPNYLLTGMILQVGFLTCSFFAVFEGILCFDHCQENNFWGILFFIYFEMSKLQIYFVRYIKFKQNTHTHTHGNHTSNAGGPRCPVPSNWKLVTHLTVKGPKAEIPGAFGSVIRVGC